MLNENEIVTLEKKVGYTYQNRQLLLTALTHSSFSNDDKTNATENYERMEFFGDSILQFLVSELLFSNPAIQTEGKLTKIRALLVCEATLANCATTLGLSKYIIMSNGGIYSGGRERPSILADVVEAMICSMFLDGGIEPARKFVKKILNKTIALAIEGNFYQDYKSALQEHVQGTSKCQIEYQLFQLEGPVHDQVFVYHLFLDGEFFGSGTGKTKKDAQQQAAKEGLSKLHLDFS